MCFSVSKEKLLSGLLCHQTDCILPTQLFMPRLQGYSELIFAEYVVVERRFLGVSTGLVTRRLKNDRKKRRKKRRKNVEMVFRRLRNHPLY